MAAEPEQQAAPAAHVHIVYVDRSKDADPEEFHLRTLTPSSEASRRPRTRCSTTISTPPAASPRSSPPSRSRSSRSNQVFFRLCQARLTISMDLNLALTRHNAHLGPYVKA